MCPTLYLLLLIVNTPSAFCTTRNNTQSIGSRIAAHQKGVASSNRRLGCARHHRTCPQLLRAFERPPPVHVDGAGVMFGGCRCLRAEGKSLVCWQCDNTASFGVRTFLIIWCVGFPLYTTHRAYSSFLSPYLRIKNLPSWRPPSLTRSTAAACSITPWSHEGAIAVACQVRVLQSQ